MSHKLSKRGFRAAGALLLAILLAALALWQLASPAAAGPALQGTEQPPDGGNPQGSPPPPVITSFDPAQITRGQSMVLSIFGTDFTGVTGAQVRDAETLPVEWVDSGTLRITLPADLPAGQYPVRILDAGGQPISAPQMLIVQDPPTATPTLTPTATLPPPLTVTGSEPAAITSGQAGILSVFGTNFTVDSKVRLVGVGLLETTFISSGALTAVLPETIPPGQYAVEVNDPVGGQGTSPVRLNVLVPPPPTVAPPEPTDVPPPTDIPPTPLPPTPVPGQPSLVVRNFAASPARVMPGDTVTLTFEVVNQGNRAALGVSVSVDSGGKFVPASGQASATLPDIGAGGSTRVSLGVVAAMDTPSGPNSVPVTLAYRDPLGEVYTSKATLSVDVGEVSKASQVTLSNYAISPNPAAPGSTVTITGQVVNTGNEAASQVLLRVAGGDNVLLAGPQGDSFPLGELAPGANAIIKLEMIVSMTAKSGPQSQAITINFLQKGEAQKTEGSITVPVAKQTTAAPLLLLESYSTGKDQLQPGDQFVLEMSLQNVGDGDASELLVTFGTVESSGAPGGDSGSEGGTPSAPSQTTTTPSTVFAPLGAGGTIFVGTLGAAGERANVKQEFIVNGTVESGIYSLPITLRYVKGDGSTGQDTRQASLVVVAPPQLQIKLQSPIPESVNVGEPFPVALEISNSGSKTARLTVGTADATNGEVVDGKEAFIGPVKNGEDATYSAMIAAQEEGKVEVTVALHYINDLNQEQTLVRTYETQAVAPPPPPEDSGPPPDMGAQPTEEPEENDTVGRFLLGLLGLGS